MSNSVASANGVAAAGVVIECRNLGKIYLDAGEPVKVLTRVDFQLAAGESAAIVGVSGAGKSTLLHLLGGLDQPSEGEVLIKGVELSRMGAKKVSQLRNRTLGFVYQFHHLLPEFTALENVAMPMLIGRQGRSEANAKALELLSGLGLRERSQHKPAELSGGERQRVAIARAMANQPACILADEPTGNLDQQTANQVFEFLLSATREKNITLLVVTHDRNLASRMDRMFVLDHGLQELKN